MNREELLGALASYVPEDPREAESLAWIRRFVAAPADPFSRANPEGHVTASAVVARPDGSEFLVVFHRKLSRWLQPGGHTEETDASAFDAALREAREETGIADFETPLGRAILDVDVHAIPARGKDPAHHHFDVRFLLTTRREIDRDAAEDPERPMKWRSLEEAQASGVDASLARALEKAHRVLSPVRSSA
ncbi:MAG: NUDIX domain-containing protein [Thermoanaerobaculia bacterium]